LPDFDVLWNTKERTDSIVETIYVSRVNCYLKWHRNINKETNPLQVDNLITDKCALLYEASRRILNTHCLKISVLANVKHF